MKYNICFLKIVMGRDAVEIPMADWEIFFATT